jgi:site-specific DNA-methyltransferase (adenine-specific)
MKHIEDKSIDLTVTSPPYDNLRIYNGYVFKFEEIAQQLFRITKDGGVVVWIVNDATINGSETLTSFNQAKYFVEECGFNLHDTMGYCKTNPLPASPPHKRYAQQFEYAFVFSKGFPKTFNPIIKPCKHAGARKKVGFRQKDGSIKYKVKEIVTKKEKVKGNLWFYQVGYMKSTKDKIAFDHPAIFPDQLAHDHIISWSNPGDVVFDPMCGSGTTLKQAAILGRNFIGCDISSGYCNLARTRIKSPSLKLGESLSRLSGRFRVRSKNA